MTENGGPDRFLGRVDVYAQARPGYPPELRTWLERMAPSAAVAADVGAGTGLFTDELLAMGLNVRAIEPNSQMRAALEVSHSQWVADDALTIHGGEADRTGLAAESVDLVVAAQAAHWFAPRSTRREFERILTPGGRVVLVWNDWREVDEPFNRDYAQVVRRFLTPGNENVQTRIAESELNGLLPGGWERVVISNPVSLSRERLHALAHSASYLPGPGAQNAPALRDALDGIFERHALDGSVVMRYRTVAYCGG